MGLSKPTAFDKLRLRFPILLKKLQKWLLWGSVVFLLYQILLPWRLLLVQAQFALATQPSPDTAVYLSHRLVDDWRGQVLLPRVEHYSLWILAVGLHCSLTADGFGSPLYWVDEKSTAVHPSNSWWIDNTVTCQAVANVLWEKSPVNKMRAFIIY